MYDNIVAVATAQGESAIAIIRLSGPTVIEEVSKFFSRNLEVFDANTINYGHIVTRDKKILDEVLVSKFKGPKSFTGEDVIEINTHGGPFVTRRVFEEILTYDFRIAEPGEFTKRAVLNGRLDMIQAEAVMDVIRSQSESSLSLAVHNINGAATAQVRVLKEELLAIAAQIEVNIDYPEYEDVEELTAVKIQQPLQEIIRKLDQTLANARVGALVTSGIQTAIIGRPNVGKSSLLNLLSQKETAIVTDVAGTTRDIVAQSVVLGTMTLHLKDTAGVRETADVVEKIGVAKSQKALEEAQFILLVLNYNEPLTEDDRILLEQTKTKERLLLVNKIDLPKQIDDQEFSNEALYLSFHQDDAFEKLTEHIETYFGVQQLDVAHQSYLTNTRHIAHIRNAKRYLEQAYALSVEGELIDFIQLDITNAWEELAQILGETHPEQFLNEMFQKFCLGK